MSEIKQEILDLLILNGRKPQTIKSGERVVYLYDALNIVSKEFSKTEQPQLNENQQTILDELKINTDYQKFNKFQAVFWLLTTIIQYPDTLLAKAYKELTQDELEQIFQAFSQWALEQEED